LGDGIEISNGIDINSDDNTSEDDTNAGDENVKEEKDDSKYEYKIVDDLAANKNKKIFCLAVRKRLSYSTRKMLEVMVLL